MIARIRAAMRSGAHYRAALLTAAALVAFAANSVLCRMALRDGLIDPASFTQIRLFSGAVFLAPFFIARRAAVLPLRFRDLWAAAALFFYAAAFSFAYLTLGAAAGALILFGAVQFTMIGADIAAGARPGPLQWAGVGVAFSGLVYLFLPGLSAPPLAGAALMAAAGAAWGAYSLLGRGAADPVAATARNFLLAAPMGLMLIFAPGAVKAEPAGIALAVVSGAVASGAGYVVWYAALRHLTTMSASVVQLAVPVIAAGGAVLFIGEPLSLRLGVASALILGGIYLALRKPAP